MNIHEYQAKELYRKYGIAVPEGLVCMSVQEASTAAQKMIDSTGSELVVVKAQIHAGGRGKAGGVKVVKGVDAATEAASSIFGKTLVTHQTGSEGKAVQRLLVEQGLQIKDELYLAFVVDRESQRVAVMASTEGGMDIEEVASKTPDKIHVILIDPAVGLQSYQIRHLAFALGLPKQEQKNFARLLAGLAKLFHHEDCSIAEINPLVVTEDAQIIALDAKVNFDSNAEFRHRDYWSSVRDLSEEDPTEIEAKKAGLSYVQLQGNIGCLVNGAGLAMSTMDTIKHFGGEPANFLDVGGGASQEAVTKAFKLILESSRVRGIFVNIFGGIMRCDVIAKGVVEATKQLSLKAPCVVRLEGTNVEEGRETLKNSELSLVTVSTMAEGARKIVELVKG